MACVPAGTTVDIGSNSLETAFRLVVVAGPHSNITAPAPTVARVGGATQSRGSHRVPTARHARRPAVTMTTRYWGESITGKILMRSELEPVA